MRDFFSFFLFFLWSVSIFSQSELPFFEDFETGTVEEDHWDLKPNITGENGVVEVALGTKWANEGQFGLRIGKLSDSQNNFTLNGAGIKLNLEDKEDVILEFDIKDFREEEHEEDGIYINSGGEEFTKIWDFSPEEWCSQTYGTHPPINISKLAQEFNIELTSQTIVEFRQYDNSDFNTNTAQTNDMDGFAIDNVKVYEANYTYATLPFYEDFELGSLPENMVRRISDNTIFPLIGRNTPMSRVEIDNTFGRDESFGLLLGKVCDESINTVSSIDINLNLQGLQNVFLDFWIEDRDDETNLQDGIYFSDNGGDDFIKVWDFLPETWCNFLYQKHPPLNISVLAENAGLTLSETFVIRFQQFDNSDIFTNTGLTNDRDGFFLDEIRVYAQEVEFAQIPFSDNFEMEGLTNVWVFPTDSKTTFPLENLIKPSSRFELVDGVGVNNSRAIALGKNCDEPGNFNAVALDLHIDADPSMHDSVSLSFFIKDNRDESQQQDAIFLSIDNGLTFFKIYEFDFEGLSNSQFHEISINLSEKAEEVGSTLSEQTIIRFQQYDDADFSTNTAQTNDKDGIYLDSVIVSSRILTNSEELDKNDPIIRVFPNPTRNFINVRIDNYYTEDNNTEYEIFLTDNLGRIVLREKRRAPMFSESLYIKNLEPGFYLLQVQSDKMLSTSKILIK